MSDSLRLYTGIWHTAEPLEKDWIEEIFRPYISHYVVDGKHELVMDDAIVFDAFTAANDPAFYARFRGKNAFLVHFLDESYEGGWEIYENFRGVIRFFWSDVFNRARVLPLPLGYNAGLEVGRPNLTPASQRKYVWSFLGQMNKASRPDMAAALSKVVPNFLFATDDLPGFVVHNKLENGGKRLFPKKEFGEFLFESSFSPSPMGNANIECFRVYEALECGSIPIVEKRITLDYYRDLLGPHPMPTVRSWREARVLMTNLLKHPASMDQLQRECIEWWNTYKVNYVAALGEFLHSHSDPSDQSAATGPMVSRRASRPGWQVRELLRHHDLPAFARRVRRQVERALHTGETRTSFRPGNPDSK